MIHVRFTATSLPPGGALHVVFGAAAVPPDGYVEPGPTTMQIGAPVRDGQQAAVRLLAVRVRDAWQAGQRAAAVTATGYGAAGRCGRGVDTAYAAAVRAAGGWSDGFEAGLRRAAGWREQASPAARAAAGWCDLAAPAARAAMGRLAGWLAAARVGQHHAAAAGAALRLAVRSGSPWQAGRRAQAVSASRWQPGRRPPFGRWDAPTVPPLPAGCYTPPPGRAVHVRFALRAMPADLHVVFRCGDGASAAVVIPTLRYYIVINSASLVRLSNNLALPVASLQIAIDADSAHWTWSATLPLATLADLERDSPDSPVELLATVNGASWHLAVERLRESERFGAASLQIGGRGIAAEISDPGYPLVGHDNLAAAANARQLAEAALTVGGAPLGWTLDWQAADWLVPAGAWVHRGTPLDAVVRIAAAAGAYVQAAPAARSLRVLPRYPLAPWEWGTATPAVVLPASATLERGTEHLTRAGYNAVYVSGQAPGGILARVKRTGSAGDQAAPMIVDPLITHADAARARGLEVLGNTGAQQLITLESGILPASGVIHVGTLMDWTRGTAARRGLVRGLSVSAQAGSGREPLKVRQTLTVETHG